MSHSILIVEDEPGIEALVDYALSQAGFVVRSAPSVSEACVALDQGLPDLVVLDWMLPDGSGVELLRRMRAQAEWRGLPVLMLTARHSESDRITGLDAGADDYLVKPFSPRELVARVRAVLRRNPAVAEREKLVYGPIEIDEARHEVRAAGQALKLGLAEFKLLRFLVCQPERVHSRAQVLGQAWTDHSVIDERTVDVHVMRLRKSLAAAGADGLVQTVRGLGYRMSLRPL